MNFSFKLQMSVKVESSTLSLHLEMRLLSLSCGVSFKEFFLTLVLFD